MANEISPFGGTELTDEAALVRQLQEDSQVGSRGGDFSYMSFSGKKGVYKIGTEGRKPSEDEPFLVATPMFATGWICWKGGKPVSKRFATMREPKIPQPSDTEFGPFDKDGDGWYQAKSMVMRSMENGEQVEFSINSKSGVAAISELQKAILERMTQGLASWAVITLGSEEFESQGYKNDKPVLKVVGWLDTDQIKRWKDDFDPQELLEEMEYTGDVKQEKKAPARVGQRKRTL